MGAFERITIEVPSDVAAALKRSVADYGFESEGQVVDIAMRDWIASQRSEENRLARLRALVDEGDTSGPSIPAENVFAELRARLTERQAGR